MVRGVWVVMGVVGLDRRWFKAIVGKSVGQSVGRSDGPGPSRVSSIRVVGPFTAPPFCIQATSGSSSGCSSVLLCPFRDTFPLHLDISVIRRKLSAAPL